MPTRLPIPAVMQSQETAIIYKPTHVSIALCTEFYHKICIIDRYDFESSIFSATLNFDAIHRLYVQREQQAKFQEYLQIGKVLWRELTLTGRAAVQNEKT